MSDLYTILTHGSEAKPGSPPPAASSELLEPVRKRPRVNQACETCRDRKTRCGGERPVCVACERRGVGTSCSYERGSVIKRKATSLDASELAEHQQRSSPVRRERHVPTYASNPGFAPINKSAFKDHTSRSMETPSRPSLPHVAERQPEVNGTHGHSSTIALLNTVVDEPQSSNDVQPPTLGQRKLAGARGAFRAPEKMFVSDGSQTLLPRRRDADDYVRCYWEYMHPLFPILHRPSFMNQYQHLWVPDSEVEQPEFDENMFMSALNIVFAIGCKFSKLVANDNKLSLADEFYQRSRRTFCYDVLDTATLSMIQLLLLVVVYLQSTHHTVRCWNAVGLAVRASQSIGLHIDPASNGERSQLQIEMRRRIWHSCVSLDRLVAMIFGRPAAMQKTDLPLPAIIDDEYLGEDAYGTQPRNQLSKLSIFNFSCQFFDVLEDILFTFYTGKVASLGKGRDDQSHDIVSSVLSFAKRIDSVIAKLPKWLFADPDAQTESHVTLQKRVLHSRILQVRLLATRPVLVLATNPDLLTSTLSGTLEDDVIGSCCLRCLETAQDLISDTHAYLTDFYRSSAWHTAFFTCASLMVLLASVKSGQVAATDPDLHSSWDQGITVLEYYQDQLPSAAEGVRLLQSLGRQMLTRQKTTDKLSDNVGNVPTPVSAEPAEEIHGDIANFSFGFDDITDSWFSQYFCDADCLEIPTL